MKKYAKGQIITGDVSGLEPYGIFINLEDDYDGLIHISEISSDFVKNVGDYAQLGEHIKAKIIDIDEEKHQIKLSIKDIDYRFNKNVKIQETIHGFETLKNELEKWKKEKINEINSRNS